MKVLFPILLGAFALAATPGQADVMRWKCSYGSIASPKGLASEQFNLEFTLDSVTHKAFIVGNAGMSPVDAAGGNGGITFLERLPTGAVQTTTIANDGASVHSRHTMIGGKLTPSQYYGRCQ